MLKLSAICTLVGLSALSLAAQVPQQTLTGKQAMGDWTTDTPGVRRLITAADLPKPFETKSANNGPKLVPRPEGAFPKVPEGFRAELLAEKLENPRKIITAPNGDLFIAESRPGRVKVLRLNEQGKLASTSIFAEGLQQPFGLAFYPSGESPQYLYVANTGSVVRFRYSDGDLKAAEKPEMIVPDISAGGQLRGGGHWTRDVVFSADGKTMYVSVGSRSNNDDDPEGREKHRAMILKYNPDGSGFEEYATGIRNAVGLAIHPQTGQLWASVNERDGLGDDLVPDYVTHAEAGGFYGWPWYYIGANPDQKHKGKRPELAEKTIVPDVLIQAHSASLCMTFYPGFKSFGFPQGYAGAAFAAQHGSWNRERRTGYKVIYAPTENGKATGEYVDFLTGFVTADGNVWGRPVGVTVAKDGALIVTEDGNNTAWRISYVGDGQR